MPSADGSINSAKKGRVVATFTIDGDSFSFLGTFESDIPTFTCSNATLNYPSLDCVTTTMTINFDGHVGPSDVELNLDNGPTMSGQLNTPSSPGQNVSGSGIWTLN